MKAISRYMYETDMDIYSFCFNVNDKLIIRQKKLIGLNRKKIILRNKKKEISLKG
jgi:hypothetical protein